MLGPIPPVSTMRAFEAAVRLGSFSAAANELGVTQSAISHQIKDLEIKLGVMLFQRLARRTVPTEDARELARAIEQSLGQITKVVDKIIHKDDRNALVISTLPGFAVQWLFPRLIDLDEHHPEISVSLKTTDELSDIIGGEADVAIRYGLGQYPGLRTERLLGDEMFPVCSPDYLQQHGPIHSPDDLKSHTLLFDDTRAVGGIEPTWKRWYEILGIPFEHSAKYKKFGQANMVVQAALAGRGVALGRTSLVIDELVEGRLVIPLLEIVPSGFAHYLVYAPNRAHVAKIDIFRRWVHEQADRTTMEIERFLKAKS